MKTIKISEHVKFCLAAKDGMKLRQLITETLLDYDSVTLDFSDIGLFASPFFNVSLGYFVMNLGLESFKSKIQYINITDVGELTIEKVIENAIDFQNSDKKSEMSKIINNSDK